MAQTKVKKEKSSTQSTNTAGSQSASSRSKNPMTMEELLASTGYQIHTLRRGQEVSGKIISLSNQDVLIDIGAKSEGIVLGREFDSIRDIISGLAVGDTVDATVVYPENDAGQVVLSLKKLSGDKRWKELEDRKNNNEPIDVTALEVNRGGVICDYFGLRGFLPASQLALPAGRQAQSPSKLSDLLNKSFQVAVIEVDRSTNRLIFSQKQPSKQDLERIVKLLSSIKIGDTFSGAVTAVLPFGIFAEIDVRGKGNIQGHAQSLKVNQGDKGKLEGLVHISEISWDKVDDPVKLFAVGDSVNVKVISKDDKLGRLNFSIKQLTPDPFTQLAGAYLKDQEISGTVSRVTPYGVFVTLTDSSGKSGASSIEGLIHVSKIPPNKTFEAGESIDCVIESVDTANRRISLVPLGREKPILYR